jgi:hypothetical protein
MNHGNMFSGVEIAINMPPMNILSIIYGKLAKMEKYIHLFCGVIIFIMRMRNTQEGTKIE